MLDGAMVGCKFTIDLTGLADGAMAGCRFTMETGLADGLETEGGGFEGVPFVCVTTCVTTLEW